MTLLSPLALSTRLIRLLVEITATRGRGSDIETAKKTFAVTVQNTEGEGEGGGEGAGGEDTHR
jgi:hypothetical protein